VKNGHEAIRAMTAPISYFNLRECFSTEQATSLYKVLRVIPKSVSFLDLSKNALFDIPSTEYRKVFGAIPLPVRVLVLRENFRLYNGKKELDLLNIVASICEIKASLNTLDLRHNRITPESKILLIEKFNNRPYISMPILGIFIAALGIAAVAVAFTILNTAMFGSAATPVAGGVLIAGAWAGYKLFTMKHKPIDTFEPKLAVPSC
jgi:hypothetical protein